MEIKIINIIDTAVKIGLGGIITGFATYYITKLNYKHELNKDKNKRYFDTLEHISQLIEESTHIILKYWSYLSFFIEDKNYKSEEFQEIELELYNTFKNLTIAESKLMLINLTNESELVREYGYIGTDIKKLKNKKNITQKDIDEIRLKLLNKRKEIFQKLSESYNKT